MADSLCNEMEESISYSSTLSYEFRMRAPSNSKNHTMEPISKRFGKYYFSGRPAGRS